MTGARSAVTLWDPERPERRRRVRDPVQTVEPYVEPTGGAPERGPGPVSLVAVVLLVLAASVLAIQSRLGVIIAVGLAIVAASLVFTLRRGFAFVEVVAFLIHFDGLGRGQVSLGRLISGVVILLLLYKLVVEKWRPPAVPVRYWLPPVMMIGWGVASAAWSPQIGQWALGLGTLGLAFAYFAVAGFLVDSYETIERFLRAYWYGGIFGAVMGVWGLILGLRAYGFNGDANLFGVLAASMIPLTIYYRRKSTTTLERVIYTVVLLLVLGGAAGAGSRSGLIGAAAALFASLVYRPGQSIGRRALAAIPAAVVTAAIALVLLLLNPITLERGTASSGRTDFWNVAVRMISEEPLVGQGLGQLAAEIPDRLATTPGSTILADTRDKVAAHNTWLDIAGDLGVVGLSIWAVVIALTVAALLSPRWRQTRELSIYLLLMFVPVLTGSMFLALANNKLAWSIIGLAAALQVPSWGNRYKGYFSPQARPGEEDEWSAGRLARWDLKISQRFRVRILLGALLGALAFGALGSGGQTRYSASVSIFAPKLDVPPGLDRVLVDVDRLQTLHNLMLSEGYAYHLARLGGLDGDVRDIADNMEITRPKAGPYLEIAYRSTDAAEVRAAGPHLTEALDTLIDTGRTTSRDTLVDEVRPLNPGEQRYYTGPMYLPVGEEVTYGGQGPRVTWLVFVGALTGGIAALSLVLLKQRVPRVNNDDDFPRAVGMPMWTHVGRNGRRNAATPDQYAQVAVTAFEATGGDEWPRRLLVATPEHSRSARVLAMGIAASLASRGQRVVLVDGEVQRPVTSWRLGVGPRPGMHDLAMGRASLDQAIGRVRRFTLPRPVRLTFRNHRDNLRVIGAGRRRRGEAGTVDPAVLAQLDPGVIVVMLAPPVLGTVPVSPSLQWADVVLYDLIEGETVTFDAEDAALQVSTFAQGPAGVVLSDV